MREVVDEHVDFIQSTDVGDLDNLDFLARTVSDMMDGLHLTKKGVGKVANMRQSAVGEVLSGKDFGLNWGKLTELCVLFHLIALAREPSTKVLDINGTSIEALASEKGNTRAVDLARRASGRMRRHTRGPCGSRGAAWAGRWRVFGAGRGALRRRSSRHDLCPASLYITRRTRAACVFLSTRGARTVVSVITVPLRCGGGGVHMPARRLLRGRADWGGPASASMTPGDV